MAVLAICSPMVAVRFTVAEKLTFSPLTPGFSVPGDQVMVFVPALYTPPPVALPGT